MADPTAALHKAVITALDSVCTCDVWDGVPQETSYPYVVVESMTSNNEDFTNQRMDVRYVFLTIWSREPGQKEVMDIIATIETLNEQPLTLDTGDVASLQIQGKRTDREADNLTFKGQVTLRIITTH